MVADSDFDGLADGFEVGTSGTRPKIWDADADSVSDGAELAGGTERPLGFVETWRRRFIFADWTKSRRGLHLKALPCFRMLGG